MSAFDQRGQTVGTQVNIGRQSRLRVEQSELAQRDTYAAHMHVEQAIAATPTGPIRELLTSCNMILQTVHDALKGAEGSWENVAKLNSLLAGHKPKS